MTGLLTLPTELLHRIVYYVDRSDLTNFRLACRSLSNISRNELFRDTYVVPTDESCEKVESILNDLRLAVCVKKVYVDTTKWDYEIDAEECCDDEGEELFLPQRFGNLFNRLEEFPMLQGVVLRFAHECYGLDSTDSAWYVCQQGLPFRHGVLKAFMKSLASMPQPIRELGIHDLQNTNETDEVVVRDIKKVLGGLHTLRLNITNEHSEGNGENDLLHPEPHQFFSELPSFWLKPTLATLQHLTIYSSNYFGFYPKFNPTGLHFPHLKTMALGNHAFIHDSQLDWILSHADTLTELYLDDCPILYEVAIYDKEHTYLEPASFGSKRDLENKHYAAYDKRWHDYFNAFRERLPHLKHFRYGHCPYWWADDSTPFEQEGFINICLRRDRYMVFCDGFGPSPYMETMIYFDGDGPSPDCNAEDLKALEDLCAKLGQNRGFDEDYDEL